MKVSSKKNRPAPPGEAVDKVVPPAKLPRETAQDAGIKQPEPELPLVTAAIVDVLAEPVAIEDAAATPGTLVEEMDVANGLATEVESTVAAEQPIIVEAVDEMPAAEAAEEKSLEKLAEDVGEPAFEGDTVDEAVEEPEPEPVPVVVPPAAKQIEISERMQLDAFIDVRYFSDSTGTKEIYHHALQITVEVNVPSDNYSVRYTKVSSDVVSTLMKYDNVVLNDLYPFNFIAPNPNSIATYFFNLLDDMLQMMDLGLYKMTMTEFPDMSIVVDQRNTAFDNMMHKGNDMFEDIRKTLPACVEIEPKDSSALKGTLSRLLKKKI
jgi:hypothetical protein